MNTISANDKHILLVTHKDDCESMVRIYLGGLTMHALRRPVLAHFMDATIVRCAVADDVQPQLISWSDSGIEPVLIVVDMRVHKHAEAGSSDGAVAMGLLDWLCATKSQIPILVIATNQIDGLESKVLHSNNVALVSLAAGVTQAEAAFIQSLASFVAPASQGRRRFTVQIGESSARYHIMDGQKHKVHSEYAYRKPRELESLAEAADRFTPYTPEHVINKEWQAELRDLGNRLFQSPLIAQTIGPHIEKMLRISPARTGTVLHDVDLRFEINVSPDETAKLFSLPLELVNPDDLTENFLCTRIPMARRIRLVGSDSDEMSNELAGDDTATEDHPLRVLFIDASVAGSVSFINERTGERTDSEALNPLQNTAGELAAIRRLAERSDRRSIDAPTVLGGRRRSPVGDDLLEQIEDELLSGHYDILHFSGHSRSLPNNGGTFLVFPDRDGRARPVSVRQVAGWMRSGGCRLIVLSSCNGSSLRTAIETMRNGAEAVVGFRWDVNDVVCIDYFRYFYRAFGVERRTLPQAYRDACRAVEAAAHGTPLWASAIAVVRD
jgi:hypothetical protein